MARSLLCYFRVSSCLNSFLCECLLSPIFFSSVSSYSVSKIKSYASSNGLTLTFIDYQTNQTVSLDDFSNYSFYKQIEHKDTILDQISTLTIYVKKKEVQQQTTTEESSDTTENNGQ